MSNSNAKSMEPKPLPNQPQPQDNHINMAGVSTMEEGECQNSNEEIIVANALDEEKHESKGSHLVGIYDKPLSYCGCGIGWFFFMFGFVFPPLWYYAAVLYFSNQTLKDPRERAGLAACAISALICTVVVLVLIVLFAVYYRPLLWNSQHWLK